MYFHKFSSRKNNVYVPQPLKLTKWRQRVRRHIENRPPLPNRCPGNMQPCFKVGPVSFSGRQIGPILYTVFQSWADYVLTIYPLWNIEVFFYSHPTRYQNCKYKLVQNYKSNFAQSNKCIGLQLSFFFLNSLYDRSWMSMFMSFVG